MHLEDIGIVLKYRPYSEKYFIVSIFSNQKGMLNSLVYRSKNALPQPGDVVNISLKARLETHLGRVTLEINQSNSALQFLDKFRVYAIQSLLEILYITLPEHHPYSNLWQNTVEIFQKFYNLENCLKAYCLFEVYLLEELGFGLSLNTCAVTGTAQNLAYVSPKTGRAVCTTAAQPYITKLLKLPSFLIDQNAQFTKEDIVKALELTAHFFNNHLLQNKKLPAARSELIQNIMKNNQLFM
jgi:DNA repair protein RecO (recombination protein O)